MSDQNREPLPQQDDSQRIGKAAQTAVIANAPENWLPDDLSGVNDYGLDLQFQLERTGNIVALFHAQVKGTEVPRYDRSGENYAVSFSAKTLNYLGRVSTPVMLLLADLSGCKYPKDAKVVYAWIDDQIAALAGGSDWLGEQETYTIYAPTGQVVTPDLDISDEIERLGARSAAERKLYASVREASGGGDLSEEKVGSIASNISRLGASVVDALASTPERPWIQPRPGAWAGELRIAAEHLYHGKLKAAEKILEKIPADCTGLTDHEIAELYCTKAKILEASGNHAEALDSFKKSVDIVTDSPHYTSQYVEARLRQIDPPLDAEKVAPLLDLLTGFKEDEPRMVAAKLNAAVGNRDAALSELVGLDPTRSAPTRVLIEYLSHDWERVEEVAISALTESALLPKQRAICLLFRARARFYLSSETFRESEGEVVPFGGPVDMDVRKLHEAWHDADEAMDIYRQFGWPSDVQYVCDIYAVVSAITGRARSAVNKIAEAAANNPTVTSVNENLIDIALASDLPELAGTAFENLEISGEIALKKALLDYYAGRKRDVVQTLSDSWEDLPTDHRLYGGAIAVGALSASETADPFAVSLEEELRSNRDLRAEKVVYDYVCARAVARSDDRSPRDMLWSGLESHTDNLLLLVHLFEDINPTNPSDSDECIDAGARLRRRRRLSAIEWRKLLTAYVTSERWREVLEILEEPEDQYPDEKEWRLYRALALEKTGDSAGALSELSTLLSRPDMRVDALQLYNNICLRCGMYRDAKKTCRALLGMDLDREAKLESARQLALIIFADTEDSNAQELKSAVDLYGSLCDQEDEQEEGQYLLLVLGMGWRNECELEQHEIESHRVRLNRFIERFPHSNILRSATIDLNADGADIVGQLEEAMGVTQEEKVRQASHYERLRSGTLVLPASERPNFAPFLHDLIHIWELGKDAKGSERHVSWPMRLAEEEGVDSSDIRSLRPLLDISALIVLNDLALLRKAITFFGTIAVSKASMWSLRQMAQPLAGSLHPHVAREISDTLVECIENVEQIEAGVETVRSRQLRIGDDLFALREAVRSGPYRFYSDDAVMRALVGEGGDSYPGMSTADLLAALRKEDVVHPRVLAEKYGLLFTWGVGGVPLPADILIASIPEELTSARDGGAARQSIESSQCAKACFSVAFSTDREYTDVVKTGASLLAYVAEQEGVSSAAIAGIVDKWLSTVRFRKDAGTRIEVHLAGVLVMCAVELMAKGERGETAGRLVASAVMEAQELALGNSMSEESLTELLGSVADQTAGIIKRDDMAPRVGEVTRFLYESLSDEHERRLLQEAYVAARVRMQGR